MPVQHPCVLLVEHESALRQLNELILSDSGYQVETAMPNDDPVEVALRSKPAVIILRIRHNVPSDWHILDRLEADSRTETIPVVVISSDEHFLVEALAAPIVRKTVVMPYDIDALRNAVADALKHPPPAALLPLAHHPLPETRAKVGKLLNQDSRRIALRAIRRLQQTEPFKSHFAELSPGLVDDIPVMLGALVVGFQRDLTPEEITPPAICDVIREHVNLRIRQGLKPSSVLLEYQVLNDQILAFLREHIGAIHFSAIDAFDVARSVDDYMGQILRVAVNDFLEGKMKGKS